MPKYVDEAGLARFWDNIKSQIGGASDEQVAAWLDAHPEATTTVQDGAITTVKLADGAVTDAKLAQTGGVLKHVGNLSNIEHRDMLEGVTFVQGSIDTTTGADISATHRIRSDYISLEGVESFTISVDDGYRYVVDWYGSDMSFAKYIYGATAWQTRELTFYAREFEDLGYIKVLVSNTSNTTILPSEASNLHLTCKEKLTMASTHSYASAEPDLTSYYWELGSIVDGNNSYNESCIRSERIPMGEGSVVAVKAAVAPYKMIALFYYDLVTGAYLGKSGGWASHNIVVPYDCSVRIIVTSTDNASISSSQIGGYVATVKAYVLPAPDSSEAKRLAKNVLFTSDVSYFEPIGTNDGMWVKLGGMWIRGNLSVTRTWESVLSESHAASPSGMADCLLIPHNTSLVYDTSTSDYALVENNAIKTYVQIPILSIGTLGASESVIGGIGYHMFAEWLTSQGSNVSTTAKTLEYAALLNASEETEQFVYFTDPHLMGSNSDTTSFLTTFNWYIDTIAAYAESAPSTFVMCGGDWLNSGDNPSVAKWKLGLVYGKCKQFGRFYGLVGNHDTNYLGVDGSGNANSGTLDNQTIANAMFGGEHANYYSFDGTHTRFYVFDSGTDWDNTMTAYRWEQVAWFANALRTDDKAHSAVSIHIWYTNYQDQTADTISALATNIASVIAAYNARTSVTLNGATYNFASCTGHVEFVICGHTHFDKSGTSGSIPVVNTLNTKSDGVPSFDLVYVDYDAHEISTVRVGTGSDRTFSLATF